VAGEIPYYFEPTDPSQLAQVFREMWENGREAGRGEQGRRRAATFSWEATAATFLDVYRGLA
jgi:glycosyltransferase involved in cell wall biosynthesis